eukprot:CAMPEP_0113536604 /NCGR_PEP_ID=MMETSP0015_2-20120614/6352_1 /TAXON_ID=2838 /ORGANISM="Odontella" /LENGTH=286 /DNA_ID=CAMNT_0000435985 /DNA_START=41 /DNA_END=902 /DNA_ORIENTATION=- /assembly_acc=CAM_ASM_000160
MIISMMKMVGWSTIGEAIQNSLPQAHLPRAKCPKTCTSHFEPVQMRGKTRLRRHISDSIEAMAICGWIITATKAALQIPNPVRALQFGTTSLVLAAGIYPSLALSHLFGPATFIAPLATLSPLIFLTGATALEVLPAVLPAIGNTWHLIAGSAALSLANELYTVQNPAAWWNVETKPVGAAEMEELREFLRTRSEGTSYHVGVELVTAYRVHLPEEKKSNSRHSKNTFSKKEDLANLPGFSMERQLLVQKRLLKMDSELATAVCSEVGFILQKHPSSQFGIAPRGV